MNLADKVDRFIAFINVMLPDWIKTLADPILVVSWFFVNIRNGPVRNSVLLVVLNLVWRFCKSGLSFIKVPEIVTVEGVGSICQVRQDLHEEEDEQNGNNCDISKGDLVLPPKEGSCPRPEFLFEFIAKSRFLFALFKLQFVLHIFILAKPFVFLLAEVLHCFNAVLFYFGMHFVHVDVSALQYLLFFIVCRNFPVALKRKLVIWCT